MVKGIDLAASTGLSDAILHLKEGRLADLDITIGNVRSIVLGTRLAQQIDAKVGGIIGVISPQGDVTPWGAGPAYYKFRVVGIFETGVYMLDDTWAYTSPQECAESFLP